MAPPNKPKESATSSSSQRIPQDQPNYERDLANIPIKINLNCQENSTNHKTDKYHISSAKKGLIVRRGQTFDIIIHFPSTINTEHDEIKLVFSAGKIKSPSQEIHPKEQIVVSKEEQKGKNMTNKWTAWNVNNTNGLRIRIQTPSSCYVGIWKLEIQAKISGETKTLKHSEHQHIYILFNPWCKEDQVHIPVNHEDHFLDEYILNDVGTIYIGDTYKEKQGKQWIFGQFEKNILDCAMHLLDTHFTSWSDRGDPIKISRKISEFVNNKNKNGILEGRWTGSFEKGTSPSSWKGSVSILNKYYKTRKPVLYGQCWVFSGVTTTLCRTLGIPARSVTNFKSFHCNEGTISHNRYWALETEKIVDSTKCQKWNYHVWNDVWMGRPDKVHYGGWQAIDATPQEKSEGKYRCGPAPLQAIKVGDVKMKHDTAFVFGEVNVQVVDWLLVKSEKKKDIFFVKIEKIERHICTKRPTKTNQEWIEDLEITDSYKHTDEQSAETAVYNALKKNTDMKYSDYDKVVQMDVKFELVRQTVVRYGEDFIITLKINNTKGFNRRIIGRISIRSMYYHGIEAGNVKEIKIEEDLSSHGYKEITLTVSYPDYCNKVVDQYYMLVTCMCRIEKTPQVYVNNDTFCMMKPTLNIKIQRRKKHTNFRELSFQTKLECKAIVTFDNPLPVMLTKCKVTAEGPGLKHKTVIHSSTVEAKATFKATLVLDMNKSGTSELIVQFNSNELKMLEGSCDININ